MISNSPRADGTSLDHVKHVGSKEVDTDGDEARLRSLGLLLEANEYVFVVRPVGRRSVGAAELGHAEPLRVGYLKQQGPRIERSGLERRRRRSERIAQQDVVAKHGAERVVADERRARPMACAIPKAPRWNR